jgi:hypothetical protein
MTDSAVKPLVLVLDTYAGFWHTFFPSLGDRVLSTSRQQGRIETKTHVFKLVTSADHGRGFDLANACVYDTGRHEMKLEDLFHFVRYRTVAPTIITTDDKKRITFDVLI